MITQIRSVPIPAPPPRNGGGYRRSGRRACAKKMETEGRSGGGRVGRKSAAQPETDASSSATRRGPPRPVRPDPASATAPPRLLAALGCPEEKGGGAGPAGRRDITSEYVLLSYQTGLISDCASSRLRQSAEQSRRYSLPAPTGGPGAARSSS